MSSDGALVAELFAAYGTVLDPWQVDALDAGLGRDEAGDWVARTVGISTARQSGKTVVLVARALAGALLFGEKTVCIAAHEVRTSKVAFNQLAAIFENYADLSLRVKSIIRAIGREEIVLVDGTRILFTSRSRNTLRGYSIDSYLSDESQLVTPEQWESVLPALSARKNSSAWLFGTAPQQQGDGIIFQRLRDAAWSGEQDESLSWIEYGAPPDCDIDDPAVWAQANPGRILPEAIRAERRELSAEGFRRERLNIWSTHGAASAVDAELWAQAAQPGRVAGNVKPTAIGLDMSPDREISLAAGWLIDDNSVHIELLETRRDPGDVASIVDDLTKKCGRRIAIVIDQASPAASLIVPLQLARCTVIVTSAADMGAACGGLTDDLSSRTVTHAGQPILDNAVSHARRRPIGQAGAYGYDRTQAAVSISPLVAAALARHGARVHKRRSSGAVFV